MSDVVTIYIGGIIIITAIILLVIGIIIQNYEIVVKKESDFCKVFKLVLEKSVTDIFEALIYVLPISP